MIYQSLNSNYNNKYYFILLYTTFIESTCFENGVHYNMGDSYRKGSFKVICRENGVAIQGLF